MARAITTVLKSHVPLMQQKILVFGANGQIGRALVGEAPQRTAGLDRSAADICSEDDVRRAVRDHPPLAIVNAAAYTAADKAESEPEQAQHINRDGAAVLAAAASAAGVPFIHISTDYVFNGSKITPYREDDPIAPLSAYGLSKAEGERAVRGICEKHIILRTSWVYSPCGTNFVRTMLRLAGEREELRIVNDQLGCPTAAADIASAILAIGEQVCAPNFSSWGIYHYCGRDAVTWYRFAELIFQAAERRGRPPPRLVPITTAEFPTPARRPAYSVLSTEKVQRTFGIASRSLCQSLDECLDELMGAPPRSPILATPPMRGDASGV